MRRLQEVYSLLGSIFFFLPISALSAQTNNHPIQVLTLNVQDRRGAFVEGIRSDQIVLKGLAATVQRFELDKAPRRILLLLDTSGSMGDYRSLSWSNVVQFTVRFARELKGDDLIGLDTFAEKDQALVPFTSDSESLVKQIEAFSKSGKGRTMLGLALTQILARGEEGLRFGDAIILVSDGDRSDADKTDFTRLRDEVTRAGIRICMVRVPPIIGPGATKQVSDVSGFIKETGGIEFNILNPLNDVQPFSGARVDPDTLASTARATYAFAQNYYRIGLKVSDSAQEHGQLQLEIVDQQKKKLKDLHVNYPRYLLPSAAKK